jgi:alpha-tubulin suppressor-like RCC1 family protein
VQVYGLNQGVIAISAGSYHTCAMTASQVFCWGYNVYGQLGSGNRFDYNNPVAVLGINHPPTRLTTGTNHSCAIQDNGVLKCWGFNRNGQLGNGTRDDATIATALEGVGSTDFTEVSAGDRHSCAITNTGEVMCWGLNENGQLGDGTITLSTTPILVIGLDQPATAIALGDTHSCVIMENESVQCWGSNGNGQLGDGTTYDEWHPVATIGLGGSVHSLSAGGQHTCAQLGGNAVQCWGDNQSGQLGDGTTITHLTPVTSSGLSAKWVGAGMQTTCAVTLEGAVKCWGTNAQGQVGDGSIPWTLTPSLVKHLVAASMKINYTDGYPGSFFTLRGVNFAGWSNALVRVNNIRLNPTIQTDSNGRLVFLLDSALGDPGGYVVSVDAGEETRNVLFHIDLDAPMLAAEDSGPVYQIPGDIALTWTSYLPWGAK